MGLEAQGLGVITAPYSPAHHLQPPAPLEPPVWPVGAPPMPLQLTTARGRAHILLDPLEAEAAVGTG